MSVSAPGRKVDVGGRGRARAGVLHMNAAADVDSLAGDVVGVGGSQEANEVGNVFRPFLTPEGNGFHHRLTSRPLFHTHRFGTDGVYVVPHAGVNDAGTIGIDGDAVRGEFFGHALGHAYDGELAGGVSKLVGAAASATDRGGIDDLASALRDHLAAGLAATHKDAANIDVEDAVEVFQGRVKKRANVDDAGIGDEDVKAAKFADDIGDNAADGVFVGDIAGDWQGAAARGVY